MIQVESIFSSSGGSSSDPLDPVQVYNTTRPSDWLPMPTPAENEMYLLFHIPDGVSSLLAFTVTCTGNYTVALGTVSNGTFVQSSSTSIASGSKYETELFADDYGNLTSDGHKQVMVKVSGTDILTWAPSTHSKKTFPSNFAGWNIVEISCRLPSGTGVSCGTDTVYKTLHKLRYFTWDGKNNVTSMMDMFYGCSSLVAILHLDTQNVTHMLYMFYGCSSLVAIPQLDTQNVMSMLYMFYGCSSLVAIPQLDTQNVENMMRMFYGCRSLAAIPQLNYQKICNLSGTFVGCNSLVAIHGLFMQNVINIDSAFGTCYSLSSLTFDPSAENWAGLAISLKDCSLSHSAIVTFFNSLPTITSAEAITLTGNPGVSELTDAEKAIATGKGWTLTL